MEAKVVSYQSVDGNENLVEFWTGECRHCGQLHRHWPNSPGEQELDAVLPADSFDCQECTR